MNKITKEEFLVYYDSAVAVDYAGFYMTIQYDEDEIMFIPNQDGEEIVSFSRDILDKGVFVNQYGEFRLDDERCMQFALLGPIRPVSTIK